MKLANFQVGARPPQAVGRPARSSVVPAATSLGTRSRPAASSAPTGSVVLSAFSAALPADPVATTSQVRMPPSLEPEAEFSLYVEHFRAIIPADRHSECAHLHRLLAALETAEDVEEGEDEEV